MKRKLTFYGYLAAFAVLIFSACSIDDNDDASVETPLNLSVSISETSNSAVNITWDDQTVDNWNYLLYFNIERSTSESSGFETIRETSGNTYTDTDVEYNTTYYYRVQAYTQDAYTFEDAEFSDYSEVQSITIGEASLIANLTAYQSVVGDGDDAVLNGVQLVWTVPTAEEIDEFEVYRDGALLTTENASSFIEEYRFLDENVVFNATYTYQIVTIDNDGNTYESEISTVTPEKPEEVERTAPEFVDFEVDFDNKVIRVIITDVSKTDNNLIEYRFDLGNTGYYWEGDVKVGDLGKDDDGNLILSLNTEGTPQSSGFTDLVSKVRIYVDGGWSDWRTHTETLSGY